MTDATNPASLVVWGGFVLAFIFGAVANKTNFCTMGAISDVVNMEHWGRIRMWLLTIAVAMISTNLRQLAGLVVLGLLAAAAWYLTGHVGFGENPETMEMVYFAANTRTLESFSFVAPTAFGLELRMLWTDSSLHATFGIASALGVMLGSFAYAISTRQFLWEGFASLEDLRTQSFGAMLMGFGGVTALACTVGQGMPGVSTLALGSFVALAVIVGGSVTTMHCQNR